MFKHTCSKIIFATVFTVISILAINFIGNNIVSAQILKNDVVAIDENAPTISIKVAETSIGSNNTEVKKTDLPDTILSLLADADLKKGAKLSKLCSACHSFNKGGKAKQGPNLWGVIGSSKASKDGFSYSTAMKEKGGNWDYESLNSFLLKPKKFVSGTKMNFAGLRKAKDRAALIAWLRTQSDTPITLP